MGEKKAIIVPGSDSPSSIGKLLENFADKQRVCTLIVRRGERFVLKIVEVRKEMVVGEVRCLHWSPEMSRKIVVLPAPFVPTRPTISPGWSSKDTPSSTMWVPYCLVTFWNATEAMTASYSHAQARPTWTPLA